MPERRNKDSRSAASLQQAHARRGLRQALSRVVHAWCQQGRESEPSHGRGAPECSSSSRTVAARWSWRLSLPPGATLPPASFDKVITRLSWILLCSMQAVQDSLAALTGIRAKDQILMCDGVPLDASKQLSAYSLPVRCSAASLPSPFSADPNKSG